MRAARCDVRGSPQEMGFSLAPLDELARGVGGQQGARQHGIDERVELARRVLPNALGDQVGSGAGNQIACASAPSLLRRTGSGERPNLGDGGTQSLQTLAGG